MALRLAVNRPVIRRSDAERWLTCNAFERETGEHLAFGQAAHDFFAAYTLLCKSAGEESVLTEVPRLMAEAWARTQGLDLGRWREYAQLCEDFATNTLMELETLLGVERTLTVDDGWAVLTSTHDRHDVIEGDRDDPLAIRITDRKTEFAAMPHQFQSWWYAQGAFLQPDWPNLQRVEFVIDHVRWRKRPDDPEIIVRGELDTWWEATTAGLRAAYERRQEGSAEPVGGPACEDCRARYQCGQAVAAAFAIPENEDQADELLADFHRMQEATKARWEGLTSFYADREPRVVNGEEVGYLIPREDAFRVTGTTEEIGDHAEATMLDRYALLKPAIPDNKAVRNLLVEAGLGAWERGQPAMKTRKYIAPKASKEAAS